MAVYDFDDIGVPEGASKKWLQKLLNDHKDACLLGQTILGEILACPSAARIDKINFCLLDVSDFERIQRLKKRNDNCANQTILSWAAWLRMHHQDPQWTPHVIQEGGSSITDFERLKHLERWDDKARVNIIDTTGLTLNEVARKVADWVLGIRGSL